MKKIVLIASIIMTLGIPHISQAQTDEKYTAPPNEIIYTAALEQEYEQCIDNPNCSVHARLQIMMNLNHRQSETLRTINQNCLTMDYKNCIALQAEENRTWRTNHKRLANLMDTIDPAYRERASIAPRDMHWTNHLMNRQDPAGGYRNENLENKGWWINVWEEDQRSTE